MKEARTAENAVRYQAGKVVGKLVTGGHGRVFAKSLVPRLNLDEEDLEMFEGCQSNPGKFNPGVVTVWFTTPLQPNNPMLASIKIIGARN